MQLSPYLVLHAICLLVGGVIVAVALRHRSVAGVSAFAIGVSGQMLWIAGYVFEVLSPTLEGKIFWDNVQLLGTIGWVVGFFRFAVHYTDNKPRWLPLLTAVSVLICGGYMLLAVTDPWHGLVRPTAELVRDGDFVALVYPFRIASYVAFVYVFALIGACVWMLMAHSLRVSAPYRAQSRLCAIGTLVPLLGVVATIFGLVPSAFRDVSPLTFAVGDSLIAWGLFRHRFLELVPVARGVVFENLRDSVVVLDEGHRVVDVNSVVLRAIGKRRVEVIGKSDQEVFAEWGSQVEDLRTVLDGSREINAVVGGRELYLEVQVTPLRGRDGRLIGRVMMVHDVSESRRAQRELERKNAELKLAFEDLDAFSYSVSHDLRAPLRALNGFSRRLVAQHGAALDGDARELVERIGQNTQRMQRLIDDLLGFARLGRRALNKQEIRTVDLVREVIAELRPESEGRDVEFVVGELPDCFADPSLLRQVFANLIGNALKYTRPRQRARIEIGADTEGYFVKDNGVGFDMQYAEHLFGVFQRLHGEDEFEGTGIGLASAKAIVARHGGAISADAKPDEGATFSFKLPLQGA